MKWLISLQMLNQFKSTYWNRTLSQWDVLQLTQWTCKFMSWLLMGFKLSWGLGCKEVKKKRDSIDSKRTNLEFHLTRHPRRITWRSVTVTAPFKLCLHPSFWPFSCSLQQLYTSISVILFFSWESNDLDSDQVRSDLWAVCWSSPLLH